MCSEELSKASKIVFFLSVNGFWLIFSWFPLQTNNKNIQTTFFYKTCDLIALDKQTRMCLFFKSRMSIKSTANSACKQKHSLKYERVPWSTIHPLPSSHKLPEVMPLVQHAHSIAGFPLVSSGRLADQWRADQWRAGLLDARLLAVRVLMVDSTLVMRLVLAFGFYIPDITAPQATCHSAGDANLRLYWLLGGFKYTI